MSKMITLDQEKAIKRFENAGDTLIEKGEFESCLSAIDYYVNAQAELYKAANDETIIDAKPYPAFNSDVVSYNAWYVSLTHKMSNAQAMLADPRIAKK